jgi:hypothetical protein
MASLLNVIDLDKTCFNVISKSGNTSETMSQYLIISDLLKQRFGKNYAKHMVITTDAQKGNLRKIAQADGVDTSPCQTALADAFLNFARSAFWRRRSAGRISPSCLRARPIWMKSARRAILKKTRRFSAR